MQRPLCFSSYEDLEMHVDGLLGPDAPQDLAAAVADVLGEIAYDCGIHYGTGDDWRPVFDMPDDQWFELIDRCADQL